MKEKDVIALASAAYEITQKASQRVDVRRHLHNLLWGDDFEQWWSEQMLETRLRNAVRERDTSLLEFIGRNIPAKDDEVPQAPQRVMMAEYIRFFLIGDIDEGVPGDGRLPKRKEVADRQGIDIKKVSEFYAELAKVTGLDLDERRPKTNVWA